MKRLPVGSLGFALGLVLAARPALPADPASLARANRDLQAAVNRGVGAELLKARAAFQALSAAEPGSAALHYAVAVADWRALPVLLGGDRAQAGRIGRDGLAQCDEALRLDARHAEAMAVRASLQGMLIQLEPGSMMTLGAEADAGLRRALSLASRNPRVWLLDGIQTLNKPAFVGGGADRALEKLRHAQALYDSIAAPDSTVLDWGRDDAWMWGGLAAARLGDSTAAGAMYTRALEINPANGRVRDGLLPALRAGGARPGR